MRRRDPLRPFVLSFLLVTGIALVLTMVAGLMSLASLAGMR